MIICFILVSLLFFGTTSYGKIYPFTTNNKIELLHDPYASKELKIAAIDNAKHHVHIMTYFLDKSKFPEEIAHAINRAHKRGVHVRIVSTLFPSLITDIFQKVKRNLDLKNKNAETVFSYLPLPFYSKLAGTNNIHEKVFIVDGEMSITGGRNIADSALRGKDLEILMHGEIVHQMQEHFRIMHDFVAEIIAKKACEVIPPTSDHETNQEEVGPVYKKCLKAKDELTKNSFSRGDKNYFPDITENFKPLKARVLTHEAIIKQYQNQYNIKERLKIQDDILNVVTQSDFETMRTYNYFVLPTESYQKFLLDKRSAGKNIKIITNSFESAKFSSNLGYILALPYMKKLISEGIDIYQWNKDPHQNQTEMYVHSKVMTFDNDRSIVGSHNFGFGSTMASNELAVEFFDVELTSEINQIFDREISSSVITKKANLELINNETKDNLKTLKVLSTDFVHNIIKELY